MTCEHFSCVISEDFGAAFDLTNSLISDGVTKIGLIGALPELNISRERELGFCSAAKQANIETLIGYGEHFNREDGKSVLSSWIEGETLPDALITTSYTLLEGVLDVLLEHPEIVNRLRIATFGDNRLLDFLPVKINSLPQQFEVIADSAMALALNAASKRYQPGVELVPRKIVVRN